MSYLQVVTPGHRVLMEADGRRFDVRVTDGFGRLCRQRKPSGNNPRLRARRRSPESTSGIPQSADPARCAAWPGRAGLLTQRVARSPRPV